MKWYKVYTTLRLRQLKLNESKTIITLNMKKEERIKRNKHQLKNGRNINLSRAWS